MAKSAACWDPSTSRSTALSDEEDREPVGVAVAAAALKTSVAPASAESLRFTAEGMVATDGVEDDNDDNGPPAVGAVAGDSPDKGASGLVLTPAAQVAAVLFFIEDSQRSSTC